MMIQALGLKKYQLTFRSKLASCQRSQCRQAAKTGWCVNVESCMRAPASLGCLLRQGKAFATWMERCEALLEEQDEANYLAKKQCLAMLRYPSWMFGLVAHFCKSFHSLLKDR